MNTAYESRFDKISGMIGKTPLLEIHFTYKGEPRRILPKLNTLIFREASRTELLFTS